MRVLMAVVGTHGDVLPFLALGRALVARGHAVSLAAPAPFAPHAARAGLGFHPLASEAEQAALVGRAETYSAIGGLRHGLDACLAAAERTVDWLTGLNPADGDTVVVAGFNAYGARIVQDLTGVPVATLHVMPFLVESRSASPRLPGLPVPRALSGLRHRLGQGGDRYFLDPHALPGLNAYRARLGLPPIGRLRHWWNSPTRMILMFPPWYAPPQLDWPAQARQVGFPLADRLGDAGELPPALAAFLAAGLAPLAFTYGSGRRDAGAFFAVAAETCRRLGRRGVLLAPQAGQFPAGLGPEIATAAYAPLSLLLPACAGLVHHGGIGTVAQALAAGVPQVVVPSMGNQFDDGERLARLGLGAVIGRRGFTAARAARVLARLTASPAVARACAAARARIMAEDGVAEACALVEGLHPGR